MNRQQKALTIQLLREGFENNQASFIVGYKGLTVTQMQSLRRALREKGGSLKVAKARLMKRAISEDQNFQALTPFLHDQIGIVFASDQPPAVAKVLHEFAISNQALLLVGGYLDAQVLDKDAISIIAKLPSREVLLAQVCGTLNAPITNLVRLLHQLIARLLYVLKRIEEQKEVVKAS